MPFGTDWFHLINAQTRSSRIHWNPAAARLFLHRYSGQPFPLSHDSPGTCGAQKTARLKIEPCCSNDRYTSRNIEIKTLLLAFIDALLKRSTPALPFFDGRFPCRLFSIPRKTAAATDDDRQTDNDTCKILSRGKAAHSSTSTLF